MAAPINTHLPPPATSATSPNQPPATTIPSEKKAGLKFLQENQSSTNLTQLADPKLSTDPSVVCITKKVFDTLPHSNQSPQMIRNRTVHIIVSGIILRLISQLGWRTTTCVTMHENWTERFFPLSAECFEKTIHRMLETDSLLWTFFLTSIIGLSAIGIHVKNRLFSKDTTAETRLQMLHQEYSAMIQVLDDAAIKCSNQELPPESRQSLRKLAYSLKANMPLINKRLQQTARLQPEQANLLTNQLSLAIQRILNATQRAK